MSESTIPTPGQAEETAQGSAPVPEQSATTPAGNGTEATGQDGAKEGYLTRAEAAALEERVLNASRSYADKGRVRVENAVKDLDNSVATLRKLGQQITPEQEKSLRDEAVRKAMVEPLPEPDGQPTQAGQQATVDPEITAILQETGIDLVDDDPEIKLLDKAHGFRKFYKSIEAACEAKKTRLASEKTNPNPDAAAARLPPSGSPASSVASSAHQLWEDAYQKH